jgi:molybdopterin converting factor small subunit
VEITVQFGSQLRQVAGTPQAAVSLPDQCCVMEALQAIAEQFGPLMAERLVAADGTPQRSVLMFVNDRAMAHDQAAHHPLNAGDVLLLYPPISGG